MTLYIVKLVLSAAIIVVVSEVSKRTGFWGGVIASLPLVSVLSMTWLYLETKDVARVASLSTSIFWFVIPSLVMFILLPVLLKRGTGFAAGMGISIGAMFATYIAMVAVLNRIAIRF